MPTDDIQEQIVKYLRDLHATEENAISQLRTGADAVEDPQLAGVLREHLKESEQHEQLVRERLEALDSGASAVKDTVHKGVAAVTGMVSGAAPDTTGKIAIQAFAFEHLEIASYRSLRTVAERAGDTATVALADRILQDEEHAAKQVEACLESAALVGVPQPV